MKQKQVMISSGDNYWVTFSSPTETYAQYEGTFDSVIASFRIPTPFIQTLLYWLIGGIGLVAGVTGIRKWLGKNRIGSPLIRGIGCAPRRHTLRFWPLQTFFLRKG
jgi:hypothetical protein